MFLGPEIITLKEFFDCKGVELRGNNLTLGSHSNIDKEQTTIKFFPDAFFGSIPMHSLSGQGNAPDSLLYKINKKLLTIDELKDFYLRPFYLIRKQTLQATLY